MGNNGVIVIGAGIAGLSTAYYLNKEGFEVTVLDWGDGSDNCSYGNAGMIVPSHIIPLASPGIISKGLMWMLNAESPFYIKPRVSRELLSWGWKFKKASTEQHVKEAGPVLRDILLKSRELYQEMEKEFDFGFRKKGLFMLCKSEKGLEEEAEVAEKARELGLPCKVLSAKEVFEMEPNVRMNIVGATYFPKDGHLNPGSLMSGLREWLTNHGVCFEFNSEVTGFEKTGNKIRTVKSSDGRIWNADYVVICAGSFSPDLARLLNTNMPIQAGKGYSITLDNPKVKPEICAIFAEAKVTMTPFDRQLRFAGTMEITGNDVSVTQSKLRGLKKTVCEYFPDYTLADLEGFKTWVGLRPCSPDGLPYVGVFSEAKNAYASTGHAMMGVSLGPVSGRIIADLISRGASELSHPLMDPNRYK